ncbi:hypothetical protein M0R45_019143 [Rubus argutus]|uniref:Cyclic nucleotide-binding domain-containing protein n=1 Tax=Rubus argutus TaxID=59490 RepID=A0AAW1X5D8_RUBAR
MTAMINRHSWRSLDGNLSGESKKKEGVHLLTSAKQLEETLNAHYSRKRKWNTFFVLACCFAVFVDPLFCYIDPLFEEPDTFMEYYLILMWTYIILRPIVDVIYMIDIIIFLMGIIRKNIAKPFRACWRTRSGDQTTVVCSPPPKGNQSIKASLLKLLPLIVLRILVVLPILEIIVISRLLDKHHDWDIMLPICIAIPIQYTLRIYDIYASLRRRPFMKTGVETWLKPILDFLPFILASHLFGALWYRLYDKSHQEPITFVRRVSQSFWWALRNLSSFGSNLNTSSSTSEIYFSILISIIGMALFLVYLNARVQEAQISLKKLKGENKKQLMIPDVDLWLSKNELPKDLKIYEKKDLKTVIMDNIHKLEKNKVMDVQSILSVLPIRDKKRIMYILCMASLRKVPLLETMNEKVLKGIVDHLKPVSYTKLDKYIVREGKPLKNMLFITQGIAWTYVANGAAGTICDSKWLKRGSFCGEEILDWAFKSPLLSDIPISSRTVIPEEQVEGFVIMASDLKSVVSKYWWFFSMKVTDVSELEQWEHLAASSIQAAWRRHAKARGPSNWDKVMKVLKTV